MHASVQGALSIEQVKLAGVQTRVDAVQRLAAAFPDLEYHEPRFCSPTVGPRCDDFGFTSNFDLCVYLSRSQIEVNEPVYALFDGAPSLFLGGNCAYCHRADPRAPQRLRGCRTTAELRGLLIKAELRPAMIERICRLVVQHTCGHGFDDQRLRTERIAWLKERLKLHARLDKLYARLAKSNKN